MSHPSSHNHKMSIIPPPNPFAGPSSVLQFDQLTQGIDAMAMAQSVSQAHVAVERRHQTYLSAFQSPPSKPNSAELSGSELLKIPKPKSRMSISIRIAPSGHVSGLSSSFFYSFHTHTHAHRVNHPGLELSSHRSGYGLNPCLCLPRMLLNNQDTHTETRTHKIHTICYTLRLTIQFRANNMLGGALSQRERVKRYFGQPHCNV